MLVFRIFKENENYMQKKTKKYLELKNIRQYICLVNKNRTNEEFRCHSPYRYSAGGPASKGVRKVYAYGRYLKK